MSEKNPHVIVIAGPNGAGKSTTAPMLLKGTLGVTEFVNADVIAQGLSAFQPGTTLGTFVLRVHCGGMDQRSVSLHVTTN
jgi:predicted ABC-type ATPase